MKMQKYRLRDVPKGKRLKHFIHYYWGHTLFVLFLSIFMGYTVLMMARPDVDFQVMWMTHWYPLTCENTLQDTLDSLDWDLNEDGHVRALLTQVDFSSPFEEKTLNSKQEVMVMLSNQIYAFYLLNDNAYEWMESADLLGTWGDLGVTDERAGEFVKIPAHELEELSQKFMEPLGETYLCISARPPEGEFLEKYESQIAALRRLLTKNGLL